MSDLSGEKLSVEAIRSGTVIDHIPRGRGLRILGRLQLKNSEARITVGLNLPSRNLSAKDLIKIDEWQFTETDAAELALFAPNATVNIVENYKVKRKFTIGMPSEFVNVFWCPNANCVTRHDSVGTRFKVNRTVDGVHLQCHFCERGFSEELFTEQDRLLGLAYMETVV